MRNAALKHSWTPLISLSILSIYLSIDLPHHGLVSAFLCISCTDTYRQVQLALKPLEPAFAEEPFKIGKGPVEDLVMFRNHPK